MKKEPIKITHFYKDAFNESLKRDLKTGTESSSLISGSQFQSLRVLMANAFCFQPRLWNVSVSPFIGR
jgi:hypothetical protein